MKDNLNKNDVDNTIIKTLNYSEKKQRKTKKIALITIAIIMILSTIVVTYALLKANSNKEEPYVEGFDAKMATKEKEDGWIYFFEIEYIRQKGYKPTYSFDGVNIKYQFPPDFNIIENEYSGEWPMQHLSNGVGYIDEYYAIHNFFNEKQFNKQITLIDLKELNISLINKNDLVELFNQAINSKKVSNMTGNRYVNLSSNIIKYDFGNDYTWSFGYYTDLRGLLYVVIEYIYPNGEHLSDIVKNNKANKEQIRLQENINKIEKYIIKNNAFDIPNELKQIEPFKTLKYRILFELDPNFE